MFICEKCRIEKFRNPESFIKSMGKCEICETYAECNDIQSSFLVKKSRRKDGKYIREVSDEA